MKISILTQPLGHNYGGLLQAYALQQKLQQMGFGVETLDRHRSPTRGLAKWRQRGRAFKNFMRGQPEPMTKSRNRNVYANLERFRNRYINVSPCIQSESEMRDYYGQNSFDIVVVGSDQVWRPRYSPSLTNFYLDFLDDVESLAKRVSYAASFGVDEWEYTLGQTEVCRELIRKFDAVSVREQSAQVLCRTHFGVHADCVVDPTLLLEADDYRRLYDNCECHSNANGALLTYILNPTETKDHISAAVAEQLGLRLYAIPTHPNTTDQFAPRRRSDFLYLGVEEWLSAFDATSFIITDSFHGCVFSLIFNKPFLALANPRRGTARFESLLRTFELEDRLVLPERELNAQTPSKPIDWDRVNQLWREQMAYAGRFLEGCLR